MLLITGASGLLGANLALAAQARFSRITAVHNRHPVRLPGVENIRADLADGGLVDELLRSRRPSWVIHCAALTDVDWCQEHPREAWQINTETPRMLARAASRVGARVVYISSDAVFDGCTGLYREADAPGPLNVYAETKLAGERAVADESPRPLLLRTNLYGWNVLEKSSLAEWVLHSLEVSRSVPGFGDVTFAPLLANDLADLVLMMMERGLEGLYHLASSEACTKHDFARKLAVTFGLNPEAVRLASLRQSPLRAPRPANTSLRTEKIVRDLGRTMPDIQSGLSRFRRLREDGFVDRLKAMRGN